MNKTEIERFCIEYRNPKYVKAQYIDNGIRDGVKTPRSWQETADLAGLGKRFFLVAAPGGVGKSTFHIISATGQIVRSGYSQKQLVLVPQEHLNENFVGDGKRRYIQIIMPSLGGEKYTWHIQGDDNFCKGYHKVVRLRKWMLTPPKSLSKGFRGKVIGGLNAVATYACFVQAFVGLTEEEKEIALHNLTLRPDEAHILKHIFSDEEVTEEEKEDLDEDATQVGRICRRVLNSKDETSKLVMTTATPYRGDSKCIFLPGAKQKIHTYSMGWIEHFNSLNIESFGIEYRPFKKDPINAIVKRVSEEPNEYHIIVIPATGNGWRKTFGEELKKLKSKLSKIEWLEKTEILDLVTKRLQKESKKKLLAEPSQYDEKDKPKIKVIIMCMLGRQGTDWCPCSRIHNAALEHSTTLATQTTYRLMRSFFGKEKIKQINYIFDFPTPQIGMDFRELLSNRTNMALGLLVWEDDMCPIMMTILPSGKKKSHKISLRDHLSDQYISVMASIMENYERLEDKDGENVEMMLNMILGSHNIVDQNDEIRNALTLRLLYLVEPKLMKAKSNPNFKMKGMDVAFIREQGFDKIVEECGIDNLSIFFATMHGSKDWELLREILRTNWDDMFLASCSRRSKNDEI